MKTLRIVARAWRIVLALIGMLLAWCWSRSGLRWLVLRGILRKTPYSPLENPRIVRRAFEALGPVFIKLGQVIASSPGLFPRRYADEFQHCLDRVPSFPLARVKETITAGLGQPLERLFASFDEKPLGSASIAQVHGAHHIDGSRVVVKVQRPGLARIVDADLWWMRLGAAVVTRLFRGARLANVSGVIRDFDRTIHEEIDFRREAANLEEFNRLMGRYKLPDVRAPRPSPSLVSTTVLVMERFDGFKADDVAGMREAGIDPGVYLRKGLKAWLMTVMLDGFFHGDAHAGNLMMMPGRDGAPPNVGLLDFGIIGRFDLKQRHQVMRYVLAFTAQDYVALGAVMAEIGAVGREVDQAALVADLERVYAPLLTKRLGDVHYEDMLPEITALAYRYGISLPSEFLLILKQLLFFDRYAKVAAPDLNVFSDIGLVDFLFTPLAAQSGLDFNVLMPLMMRIQARVKPA